MSGLQIAKVFLPIWSLPIPNKLTTKRLAIDLSALKQLDWHNRDDCDEEVDGSRGDYLRWIDTSAMLSDCLMKTMTMSTSIFEMRLTKESVATEANNWKWITLKKEQERLQDSNT